MSAVVVGWIFTDKYAIDKKDYTSSGREKFHFIRNSVLPQEMNKQHVD